LSSSSPTRPNLPSTVIRITNRHLGEEGFRIYLEGIYQGGDRNQQEAACTDSNHVGKACMESEYFASDLRITDTVIRYAEEWNDFADSDETILVIDHKFV